MDKIIKILAAKHKLDEEIVERMVRSQFNFVAATMQQGDFESVHLHHFGKFAVKPRSIQRVTDMKEKSRLARERYNASKVSNDI